MANVEEQGGAKLVTLQINGDGHHPWLNRRKP